MILDNWRVLHGRSSFTGSRTMGIYIYKHKYSMIYILSIFKKIGGCYIDRDDYISSLLSVIENSKNKQQQ